jgi:hypothetical protein
MLRTGVIAVVLCVLGCASSSGEGLSLLQRAVDASTVRVLVDNLTREDTANVDLQEVCTQTLKAQGIWFDALRLLGMQAALRSYSRCGVGVNVDLIEATTLPLTAERRQRIERYIDRWKPLPVKGEAVDEIFLTPAVREASEGNTSPVLMALQADGTADALRLCDRLAAKVGSRCSPELLTGRRVFDTPESAVANDPFLTQYKPRHVATSRDGLRRFYILDTLKRPHDDTCRPVAVLASAVDGWSLERVECETTSGLDTH